LFVPRVTAALLEIRSSSYNWEKDVREGMNSRTTTPATLAESNAHHNASKDSVAIDLRSISVSDNSQEANGTAGE